jgi:transglutaminase-like putative cysteine protease
MWLRTSCDLSFDVAEPTSFVLMLRPRSGAHQWVAAEEYRLEPSVPVQEFTDIYGNLCQRLVAPVGPFSIHTAAEIMISEHIDEAPGAPFIPVAELPEAVLNYLLPSRYCEADRFSQMTQEISAGQLMGYDQVTAIVDWISSHIRYDYEGSELLLSATEVNQRRSGVCRDLAHLGIAMCRSLCIPARMVVGYLHELEPMDLHAWFEVYVGHRWYTFDAMRKPTQGAYVAIGYGRDAADVAIFNQYGPALFPISQTIAVSKIEDRT